MKENKSKASFTREELFHDNMTTIFEDINKDFVNRLIKEKLDGKNSQFKEYNLEIKLVYVSDVHVYSPYSATEDKYKTDGIRTLFFEFNNLNNIDERFILDKYYMQFDISYRRDEAKVFSMPCDKKLSKHINRTGLFGYIDSPFNVINYDICTLLEGDGNKLIEMIQSSVENEFCFKKQFNKFLLESNENDLWNLYNYLEIYINEEEEDN